MDYYLYEHVRLDTGQVFYIGIGTKVNSKNPYKRAYSSSRNYLWKRIVAKTNYQVNILKEFSTKAESLVEEEKLIIKYGRIIKNSGQLCNIIISENEREELRLKNLKLSIEKLKIKTYKYSLEGNFITEYSSISEAAYNNNTLPTDICLCFKGLKKRAGKFMWKNFKIDKIKSYKECILENKKTKKVYQYDLNGNFVKEWKSILEITNSTKIKESALRNCLCELSKSCNNFKWFYSKQTKDISKKVKLQVFCLLKNNFLGEFYSFSDAENFFKLPKNSISVYLKRNKPHYKYIFKTINNKQLKNGKS